MFTSNQATCLFCRLNIGQSILKPFKTLRTLTVRMSGHTSLPNELSCDILDIGLRESVTPATLWASVTLVPVQTMSMGQSEPDITLMSLVLYVEIVTHIVILFSSDILTQVNSLQLRCSDIVTLGAVLALTTLSFRDVIVVPPLVREGRRRSHIRRGNTLPLLVLLFAALPLLLLEKEKENGTSLKRRRRNTLNHFRPNVIRVRRSTRGRGVLLHHLLLCLLQFLQTILLFFREAQPGSSLELIRGLLLWLMTFLIPLLGLRVGRHTGIISVFCG